MPDESEKDGGPVMVFDEAESIVPRSTGGSTPTLGKIFSTARKAPSFIANCQEETDGRRL